MWLDGMHSFYPGRLVEVRQMWISEMKRQWCLSNPKNRKHARIHILKRIRKSQLSRSQIPGKSKYPKCHVFRSHPFREIVSQCRVLVDIIHFPFVSSRYKGKYVVGEEEVGVNKSRKKKKQRGQVLLRHWGSIVIIRRRSFWWSDVYSRS